MRSDDVVDDRQARARSARRQSRAPSPPARPDARRGRHESTPSACIRGASRRGRPRPRRPCTLSGSPDSIDAPRGAPLPSWPRAESAEDQPEAPPDRGRERHSPARGAAFRDRRPLHLAALACAPGLRASPPCRAPASGRARGSRCVQWSPRLSLPRGGALDDELRDGGDVPELEQVARHEVLPVVLGDLLLQERDAAGGAAQARVATGRCRRSST